jgi:hypothetical protein
MLLRVLPRCCRPPLVLLLLLLLLPVLLLVSPLLGRTIGSAGFVPADPGAAACSLDESKSFGRALLLLLPLPLLLLLVPP